MTVRSTWFITGAAGGIGRELTEQLLAGCGSAPWT